MVLIYMSYFRKFSCVNEKEPVWNYIHSRIKSGNYAIKYVADTELFSCSKFTSNSDSYTAEQ